MDHHLLDIKQVGPFYYVNNDKIQLKGSNCTPKQFAMKVFHKFFKDCNKTTIFYIESTTFIYKIKMTKTKLDEPVKIGNVTLTHSNKITLLDKRSKSKQSINKKSSSDSENSESESKSESESDSEISESNSEISESNSEILESDSEILESDSETSESDDE